MNIVIVGAGEVGQYMAGSLSSQLHNICVIEPSEKIVEDLRERMDIRLLCGSGTSATTLAEADVGECHLFLALTSDDNTNLVAASMARAMGAEKVVARVHGSTQRDEWLFDYRAHFQIDYLFSTERLAAVELAKFVRNPERLAVEELARGRIELQQIYISPHSEAVDQPIRDLKFPPRVRIAFIQRFGENIVPSGDEYLQVGDLITLFGAPSALQEVVPMLQADKAPTGRVNVVIFGGNDYGFALAQMLEGADFKVRIMEQDASICRDLASTLQRTVVIHGDATSLQQLKEEQVGEADFFIAASRDDEDNVMTCLQAQSLGTKYSLALIHRSDYADVISQNSERLGILGAVSPRVATSRDLLRFVTSDEYHVLMTLSGGTEVLEIPVADGCRASGCTVADIPFPEGGGLVAVLHEHEAFVPVGEDLIKPGDTVYAIATPEARKPLAKLFAGR